MDLTGNAVANAYWEANLHAGMRWVHICHVGKRWDQAGSGPATVAGDAGGGVSRCPKQEVKPYFGCPV